MCILLLILIVSCDTTTTGCGEFLSPSFLLIGERKCGTTSLFQFLLAHPEILPPIRKELSFFNRPYKSLKISGMSIPKEYCSNFPTKYSDIDNDRACMEQLSLLPNGEITKIEPYCKSRMKNLRYMSGEASATYLTQANPFIIADLLPHVKLIVSFRCPIKRALSHHAMHLRFKHEQRKRFQFVLPLNEALAKELEYVAYPEVSITMKQQDVVSHYLKPGIYISQLNRWFEGGRWKLSDFYIVFQEEMDEASLNSKESLQKFLMPIWNHIGVQETSFNSDLEFQTEGTSVMRFNAAPVSAPDPKDRLTNEMELQLCREIYFKANRDLAVLLHRSLPKQWKCL